MKTETDTGGYKKSSPILKALIPVDPVHLANIQLYLTVAAPFDKHKVASVVAFVIQTKTKESNIGRHTSTKTLRKKTSCDTSGNRSVKLNQPFCYH